MAFTSIEYLLFLPLIVALYYACPRAHRWLLLLVASYAFYMFWKPKYALIMAVLTIIDYVAGPLIYESKTQQRKLLWLWVSLVANLSILFFFKYYNFFSAEVNELATKLGGTTILPVLNVLLPLGISFHTFQAMSYNLDIYHGKQLPERHFGYFALYIAYFPQLVAGPIERGYQLLTELKKDREWNYDQAASGAFLILWGFFKKLVVADNLGVIVDGVYADWTGYTGLEHLITAYAFAFQIYCDFSGYTDIARGSGRLLGVNMVENFNSPYLAQSVAEFWRRWHMSLTSWFRDYVFKPFLGQSRSPRRKYAAVLLVFTLSGIWHGANWTFLMWGLLNAIFYFVGEKFGSSKEVRVPRATKDWLRVFATFNLICLTWIFFRASNVLDGFGILGRVLRLLTHLDSWKFERLTIFPLSYLYFGTAAAILMMIAEWWNQQNEWIAKIRGLSPVRRWALYVFLFYVLILIGNMAPKQFIYFQF